MPYRPHLLHAYREWLSQPALPAMLPNSLVITLAKMTPKKSLLMPHLRRSAISEHPVIPLKGKTMCYILLTGPDYKANKKNNIYIHMYVYIYMNTYTHMHVCVKYSHKMIKAQFHLILVTKIMN